MGYDVGACGVFGIRMDPMYFKRGPIASIYKKLDKAGEDVLGEQDADDSSSDGSEIYVGDEEWIEATLDAVGGWTAVEGAFKKAGITLPKGACLHWSGSNDDRPGRTDTPPDIWLVGFGLYTKPQDYPKKMDSSFLNMAQWHTWVWGG